MSDYPKDGEPLVILWEWQHFALDGEPMDSVEEAAFAAEASYEAGAAAFACIEVINPDGTMEMLDDWRPYLPPPSPTPEGPPKVARVMIGPPPRIAGKPGARPFWWSSHETRDEAEAEAARWRVRLGADRVKVEPTP